MASLILYQSISLFRQKTPSKIAPNGWSPFLWFFPHANSAFIGACFASIAQQTPPIITDSNGPVSIQLLGYVVSTLSIRLIFLCIKPPRTLIRGVVLALLSHGKVSSPSENKRNHRELSKTKHGDLITISRLLMFEQASPFKVKVCSDWAMIPRLRFRAFGRVGGRINPCWRPKDESNIRLYPL